MKRCDWPGTALSIAYHDDEWGVPLHDDRRHFEFLLLDGAQAGLSWETILRKREGYRAAFDGFDPKRIARYGPRERERLLNDPGIVRNRAKIGSAIGNAKAFLDVQAEFGSFDDYVWRFVDGSPVQNAWRSTEATPARTAESEAMSEGLKRRGFTFVGPTICYAYMQAAGLVNDHVTGCFRRAECAAMAH